MVHFQVLNMRSNAEGELIVMVPSKLDRESALKKRTEKEQIIGSTAKKATDRRPRISTRDVAAGTLETSSY